MATSKKKQSVEWKLGTVHWFDELSGDGLIKDNSGKNYYVHYSAIESKGAWKTLKDKSKVKFQLVEDEKFVQVKKIKELE